MIDFKVFGLFAIWLSLVETLPKLRDVEIQWKMVVKLHDEAGSFTGEWPCSSTLAQFYSCMDAEYRRQNPTRTPLPYGQKADWV